MQVNQNYLIARVVNFLNQHGYCAWRQENNGRIDEQEATKNLLKLFDALLQVDYTPEKKAKLIKDVLRKAYRKVPSSMKGVTDVIGFDLETARWITVEVKIGEDQVRPDQQVFMDKVRRANGSVWICRDFDCWSEAFLRDKLKRKGWKAADDLSPSYVKSLTT